MENGKGNQRTLLAAVLMAAAIPVLFSCGGLFHHSAAGAKGGDEAISESVFQAILATSVFIVVMALIIYHIWECFKLGIAMVFCIGLSLCFIFLFYNLEEASSGNPGAELLHSCGIPVVLFFGGGYCLCFLLAITKRRLPMPLQRWLESFDEDLFSD